MSKTRPRWTRTARLVKCSARAKSTGGPCPQWAVRGSNVCHMHGAAKGTRARAAADRRDEEERIRVETEKAVGTYGLPRDVAPGQAVIEEIHRSAGAVAWLQAKVSAVPADQVHDPAHAALLSAYRQERAHLARVAADAVKCGIRARQVDAMEKLAGQVLAVVKATMIELGHDPDDPRILQSTTRQLRIIDAQAIEA